MQRSTKAQAQLLSAALMLSTGVLLAGVPISAQTRSANSPKPATAVKSHARRLPKKVAAAQQIVQPAPTPPAPQWPINATPSPASVVWDSSGLRINASNSSLQQILHEVSTETGTKIVGSVPDQRVYGTYGPGDARDVLSQLLLGSGYNVLLSGELGHGAPSQMVLSPRRAGPASAAPNGANRPQQDPDEEIPEQPEQPEEEPQPQVQQPPISPEIRPGFGPNGPMRTPQQVMEEMQQRQLLQQQQMQQQIQQQQQNNPTAPQENPQQ